MQIKSEQLEHHLSQNLLPIYMVSGNEPFIVQEAAEMIRKKAFESGVTERKLFQGTTDDFQHLGAGLETMSLFAEQTLYEFRLTAAPKKAQTDLIKQWCTQETQDDFVIICCPQLDKRTKSSAWYKSIDQIGSHITVWPVKAAELPSWLDNRARKYGLSITAGALSILAQRTEGNLLAANQELQRLAIGHKDEGQIDEALMADYVANNARFGVYEMLDSCLMGDASKAVRMLQSLEQEGEAIMRIATLVAFELRKLCSMSWSKEKGSSLAVVFRENRVWQAKQRIYASALDRYPARVWQQLLQRCLTIDKMIKGQQTGNTWLTLESLMLVMAGRKQFAKAIVRE